MSDSRDMEMNSPTRATASPPAAQDEERKNEPFFGPTVTHQQGEVDAMANDGDINYKSMSWWNAGMLMVAETISLGILSLPNAMATLGLVPGLICLLGLGLIASYTGYVIGQYRLAHPAMHSFADGGQLLMGRPGRWLFGGGQLLFYVLVMGSHILTFSVMMNAITEHASCTVLWSFVGMVLSFLCTIPRTLRHMSWYSVASFASIIGAVMITMIGVSVTKPGWHPNPAGNLVGDVRWYPAPGTTFYQAFLAVTNMIFAYAGHVAFPTFISELKDPRDFPKALAFLQTCDISMYIIVAVVVYWYAGNDVASPALDSASVLVAKVAWGIAMPTIVIAGVVNGHVAVKYVYVALFGKRRDNFIKQNSRQAIGAWLAIVATLWIAAFLIAEAVPVFSDLLGLTSALFASWFTIGLSGVFWFSLNLERQGWRVRPKNNEKWSTKKVLLLCLNVCTILMGAVICVVGLYATGVSIASHSSTKKPFSCADNSRFRGQQS